MKTSSAIIVKNLSDMTRAFDIKSLVDSILHEIKLDRWELLTTKI